MHSLHSCHFRLYECFISWLKVSTGQQYNKSVFFLKPSPFTGCKIINCQKSRAPQGHHKYEFNAKPCSAASPWLLCLENSTCCHRGFIDFSSKFASSSTPYFHLLTACVLHRWCPRGESNKNLYIFIQQSKRRKKQTYMPINTFPQYSSIHQGLRSWDGLSQRFNDALQWKSM